MPEELWRIKKWLRSKEVEDPIASKSQDRVLTSMARDIRATKALPKGPCQLCSTQTERLIPVPMKVCRTCMSRFLKRGTNLIYKGREQNMGYCDHCMGKTFTMHNINPQMCIQCSRKIGRRHKHDGREVQQDIQRERGKLL